MRQVWYYFHSMQRHIMRKMLPDIERGFVDMILYGTGFTRMPTAEQIDEMLKDWRPNRRCKR